MPKRSSDHRPRELGRKQASRRRREARTRQWLIGGTVGVLGLVVLILGWGLYEQYVLRPRKPVATVSGVPIYLKTYQDQVRYRRWYYRNYLDRLEGQKRQLLASEEENSFLIQYIDQQIAQVKREIMNLPTSVLEALIDDQLVRQECERQGITVSPEQVQLRLEAQFGYDRNPPTPVPITTTLPITVTPTPTAAPMTEELFLSQSGAWFQSMYEATGVGESEYRTLLEGVLYREKLEEVLTAALPTAAEQVQARHILLQTREEADAALARLRDGEDFAELAAELSIDTATKEQGGDLGWFPRGQMTPAFSEAAFALQPGETSEVVETEFGYHIIRLDQREADRELDPTARLQAERKAISDWFAAQRISQTIVQSWDSSMVPKD